MKKRTTVGERWYRRVLRVYPRDFRDEFGGELTRLYRDRARDEPWWRLWAGLAADVVTIAPSEHLAILRQDLRQAWRGLRRTPLITATAILTLALGVGASTAVFSVVHALLLRPLPYAEPDRLVELFESNVTAGVRMRASALNYLSWTERSVSFDAIAAFQSAGLTLTDGGDPEVVTGAVVTASLFRVLRVPPIAGRTLQPEDERGGGPRVVVLGESLWRNRFGSDPQIVGRAITLDGERYEVVGVMPRAFREVGRAQAAGAADAQILLPLAIDPARENRANHTLRVVGRLREGVQIEQARDEMRAVAAALEREFPATNAKWSVAIEPLLGTTIEAPVRRALLLVLGAVTMVFLIACANVANLMLARASLRHGELAVRTALGAGRSRLVRQLLTESCCLAVVSGAAGVFVAATAHPLVKALLPPTLPRLGELHLDMNVLALGLVVSTLSGLVFGVVPALHASRPDVSQSLTLAGRGTDSSRPRLRQSLIVAQIAIATMLLVGGVLLLQGLVRLQHVPLGFEPDRVVTVRIALPRGRYADADRIGRFYTRLVSLLAASGQVRHAAVGTSAPFGPGVRAGVRPNGRGQSASPLAATEGAVEHIVSGNYFRVLGVPLLAGRSFSDTEIAGTPPVAVVSERLARMLWPNVSPLGQMVERSGQAYQVIGVVGDVRGSDVQGPRGGGPEREARAAFYLAASQAPQRTMTLLLRVNGEPASVVGIVRTAIRELDPALPLQQMRPLSDWLAESLAPTRLTTSLAALFAMSALLLASVGIYGVLAYTVVSRTKEIGLRVALGATRRRVMALVLGEGLTWAGSGIALGLLGAFAASSVLATLVFDIPVRDPLTFALVAAIVALVALTACLLPAARAVRIDPTIAMRVD